MTTFTLVSVTIGCAYLLVLGLYALKQWYSVLTAGPVARLHISQREIPVFRGAGGGLGLGFRLHYPIAIQYVNNEVWMTWTLTLDLVRWMVTFNWLSRKLPFDPLTTLGASQ